MRWSAAEPRFSVFNLWQLKEKGHLLFAAVALAADHPQGQGSEAQATLSPRNTRPAAKSPLSMNKAVHFIEARYDHRVLR